MFLENRLKIVAWFYLGLSVLVLVISFYMIRWPQGLPQHKPNLAQVVEELPWKQGLSGIFKQRSHIFILNVSVSYLMGINYFIIQVITLLACSSGYSQFFSKFGGKLVAMAGVFPSILFVSKLIDKHVSLSWLGNTFKSINIPKKIKLTKMLLL